ncbi:unnamed protein product [Moneuplotes crassus]|uniref:Uncharacterized protein n=1 Tax=Euplotes crassus TaxID=5936 RepID=A0AAD1Y5B8_EUPCR|nr:unnamed protein product [Moneuplotes crassus]CAI2384785.1 unnamed protein product [Moneuplotes crassus]
MNKLITYEENLSEEFLDEHASASSVNISPNIAKNMEKCFFNNKIEFVRNNEPKTPPLGTSRFSTSPCITESKQDSFLTVPKRIPCINFSKTSSPKSNLQSDIKSLLHKAMEIRAFSNPIRKGINTPANLKPKKGLARRKLVRGVTIHDCESAKCFQ